MKREFFLQNAHAFLNFKITLSLTLYLEFDISCYFYDN